MKLLDYLANPSLSCPCPHHSLPCHKCQKNGLWPNDGWHNHYMPLSPIRRMQHWNPISSIIPMFALIFLINPCYFTSSWHLFPWKAPMCIRKWDSGNVIPTKQISHLENNGYLSMMCVSSPNHNFVKDAHYLEDGEPFVTFSQSTNSYCNISSLLFTSWMLKHSFYY